jgi:hypothetical protein
VFCSLQRKLILPTTLLFGDLYFPAFWPTIANEQVYPTLVEILTAGRAHGFTDPYILSKNPIGPIPDLSLNCSYSRDGIVGADGAASNGVPLKEVFQDLVATTRGRAPTRMSSILVASKYP